MWSRARCAIGPAEPAGRLIAPHPTHAGRGLLAILAVLVMARTAGAAEPPSFEANQGQFPAEVRFASRGPGYTVFLTDDGAVMVLRPTAGARGAGAPSVIRLGLDGAVARRAVGRKQLPGVANYLRGADQAAWRTGIPTYEQVVYDAVYPGVDLVYYGADRGHEYDLVVAPGADPAQIRLAITGADRARLDEGGDLELTTAAGTVTMRAPHVYQEIDGGRRQVTGRYAVDDKGRIGFTLGAYDTAAPLVIDPQILYSTFVGGSGNGVDSATGVAVDAAGAAYVVGTTETADFPTLNPLDGSRGGLMDAFVMKLAPDGTRVYATYLGGSSYDDGVGIAVRADGVAYVVGNTSSTDFPVPGAYQPLYGGNNDAYVVELNAAGSAVSRGTYLGGSGIEAPRGVQLTQYSGTATVENLLFDSVIVYGSTTSTNFPVENPSQPSRAGDRDAFVAILERATFLPRYASYAGVADVSVAEALTVNRKKGAMYLMAKRGGGLRPVLVGFTRRVAADASASPFVVDGGRIDIETAVSVILLTATEEGYSYASAAKCPAGVIAPVNSETTALTEVICSPYTVISGQSLINAEPLASVVMALMMPGCIPVAPAPTCSERAVMALLNAQGNAVASVNFGGTRAGREFTPTSAVLDARGRLHVIGTTADLALPLVNPVQPTNRGSGEGFVMTLDPLAGTTSFLSYLGGSGYDTLNDIAVDADGNRWIVGDTQSTNFTTTLTAFQPALNGRIDGFVTKISADPPGPAAPTNLVAQTSGLSVVLSWAASAGAQSYQLEAGSAPLLANLANVNVGNVTSLPTSAPAGTYYVRVRAVTAAGLSGPSNEVTVVLAPPGACTTPPPAPTGHVAQTANFNVTVGWNASAGATSYVLEAGTASGLANVLAANLGATTSFSAVGPPGTFFTRVRAVNACGASAPSNEVSFTLGCSAPAAPSGLTFTKAGNLLTVSWSAVPGASSYRLRAGTAPGLVNAYDAEIGNVPGVQFGIAGIPPGQYFVTVVATSVCGASAASNEVLIPIP